MRNYYQPVYPTCLEHCNCMLTRTQKKTGSGKGDTKQQVYRTRGVISSGSLLTGDDRVARVYSRVFSVPFQQWWIQRGQGAIPPNPWPLWRILGLDLDVLQCRTNLAPRRARECTKMRILRPVLKPVFSPWECPLPRPHRHWGGGRPFPKPHSHPDPIFSAPTAPLSRHGPPETQILDPPYLARN